MTDVRAEFQKPPIGIQSYQTSGAGASWSHGTYTGLVSNTSPHRTSRKSRASIMRSIKDFTEVGTVTTAAPLRLAWRGFRAAFRAAAQTAV